MGTLDSSLTSQDLDTLIDAMHDWEAIGNHEYHVMNMVRNAPMPPQDHEAYEFMQNIKDHFKQREKDIKDTRALRQETAIFLKAKLMLIRRDIGIDQLFVNAAQPVAEAPAKEIRQAVEPDKLAEPVQAAQAPQDPTALQKLELAEEFIRDLGVWTHYEKFLVDKKSA